MDNHIFLAFLCSFPKSLFRMFVQSIEKLPWDCGTKAFTPSLQMHGITVNSGGGTQKTIMVV